MAFFHSYHGSRYLRLGLVVFLLVAFFAAPAISSLIDSCEDHCEASCDDCGDCADCMPTVPGLAFANLADDLGDGHNPEILTPVTARFDRAFATGIDRPPRNLLPA